MRYNHLDMLPEQAFTRKPFSKAPATLEGGGGGGGSKSTTQHQSKHSKHFRLHNSAHYKATHYCHQLNNNNKMLLAVLTYKTTHTSTKH